jgi:hypothetical protein
MLGLHPNTVRAIVFSALLALQFGWQVSLDFALCLKSEQVHAGTPQTHTAPDSIIQIHEYIPPLLGKLEMLARQICEE